MKGEDQIVECRRETDLKGVPEPIRVELEISLAREGRVHERLCEGSGPFLHNRIAV